MKDERNNHIRSVCEQAVEKFGAIHQMDKAIEEMSELTTALQHYKDDRASYEEVISEIADVSIMMYQMALLFGLDEFQDAVDEKIQRQEERMAPERKVYIYSF